jgi:hypothetical protein
LVSIVIITSAAGAEDLFLGFPTGHKSENAGARCRFVCAMILAVLIPLHLEDLIGIRHDPMP